MLSRSFQIASLQIASLKIASFVTVAAAFASATTPVVTVTSPTPGAGLGSPLNYVASASSPGCSKGIAAMRIYTAPGVSAYTVNASSLNTNINLPTGTYNTVVQAWDNCGGVGKTSVNVTVSKINLSPAKFLYATEYKAGRIAEYVVNPLTGSVTSTSQGSTSAHSGPVELASDPGGYRLYAANYGSHDLNAYYIYRNSGNLYPVPGSPFALTGIPERVVVHPTGHFVYVIAGANSSTTDIDAFTVQSNGSLAPVPGSPFSLAAGNGLATDPSGKYLFAGTVGAGNTAAIAVYTIDQVSGALTPIPGSPFTVPTYPGCTMACSPWIYDLQVDPTGNYLYGTVRGQDRVAGFKIDPATGTLSNLPGSPYSDGTYNRFTPRDPSKLRITPTGKFLYTADVEGAALSVFAVNTSTGVLTYKASLQPCTDPNVAGFYSPYSLGMDPSGSFIYTQGFSTNGCNTPPGGTNDLAGFSLDQGSGFLFSVPGNPFSNPNLYTTDISQESVVVTK